MSTEVKQREPAIAETEQRITELEQQLEKGRLIDERIKKLKERRSTGRLLLLTEQMQEELDQKDRTIRELKVQLDESLTLNERLNSENRAGNIQALKNDLRKTKELLQSEKEKTLTART